MAARKILPPAEGNAGVRVNIPSIVFIYGILTVKMKSMLEGDSLGAPILVIPHHLDSVPYSPPG
jgi:hypothetical protein